MLFFYFSLLNVVLHLHYKSAHNLLHIIVSVGKEVIRRWTNLRDAFAKSLKKMKEGKSSGSAAKKTRHYVYNDELNFLRKLYAERETSNSLSEDNGTVEDDHQLVEKVLASETEVINSESFKKPTATRKHKKVDEVELKILKALEPKEPEKLDPNMSFFQSLLPHLNKFNAEEILQFQMGVLQIISNLHERKKGAVHPHQYTQQTNYHNPSHIAHPSFSQLSPFHNQPPQFLVPVPTNQISEQYHQYNQSSAVNQFSQPSPLPSQTQSLITDTPSKNSPHRSSLLYTRSKTRSLSENDDSSNFGEETEYRKSVNQFDEGFLRPEAANTEVSSPESIASPTYSVDFSNL